MYAKYTEAGVCECDKVLISVDTDVDWGVDVGLGLSPPLQPDSL